MINVHSADLNVACGTPDPILKDVGNYAINRL